MKNLKLKQVTFTGVDNDTNPHELQKIQKDYPIAEFGVLVTKNWAHNPRCLDPEYIPELGTFDLNLSCHLCGELAREALNNNFKNTFELVKTFGVFKRCQLNVSREKADNELVIDVPDTLEELIIQQPSADNCNLFFKIKDRRKMTVLIDGSGGKGIETELKPLKADFKVGYAGGLNADNIRTTVSKLFESEDVGDFWVDMETGCRTDNKFDLEKVVKVLKNFEKFL